MSDTVKTWIEERRAIHTAADTGRWYAFDTGVGSSAIRSDEAVFEDMYMMKPDKTAVVDAHNMFPRTLDAIEAVLKVHRPGDVFTWAEDCADPENHHLFTDVRTGDMLCEDEPIGRFCNGCVPENDTTIDVDEYPWPCRTVRPIEEAINGE